MQYAHVFSQSTCIDELCTNWLLSRSVITEFQIFRTVSITQKTYQSLSFNVLINFSITKKKREHFSALSSVLASIQMKVNMLRIYFLIVWHLRVKYSIERASTRAFARMLMKSFVSIFVSMLGSACGSVRKTIKLLMLYALIQINAQVLLDWSI
jgi:hypothetical protein